jgi:hypothetical protein
MLLATALAEIAMASQRRGMTGAEGAQNFPVMGRQAMSVLESG